MKALRIALAISLSIIINGCTSKNSDPAVLSPAKASLTFPSQNSVCTTGTVISDSESTIEFSWNASANTNSYDLVIKNLLTNNVITKTTINSQLAVTLLRNTPYAWSVVSKSTTTTDFAVSDTWKFYNAGLGISSHPPFPADVVAPVFGQSVTATSGMVNLSWTGSDADNDIASYDIYFGTTTTPALIKSSVFITSVSNVAVNSGTTYYWKVVTKDAQGNASESNLFQFRVN